jgi:hypothetical protein
MCRKCINYISPFSGCLHLNHSTANSLQTESLFSLLLTSQNSVSHPSTQSTLSLGRSDHLTLLVSTLHSSLLRRKPYSLAWQAKAWGSNPFVPHYPQNLSTQLSLSSCQYQTARSSLQMPRITRLSFGFLAELLTWNSSTLLLLISLNNPHLLGSSPMSTPLTPIKPVRHLPLKLVCKVH